MVNSPLLASTQYLSVFPMFPHMSEVYLHITIALTNNLQSSHMLILHSHLFPSMYGLCSFCRCLIFQPSTVVGAELEIDDQTPASPEGLQQKVQKIYWMPPSQETGINPIATGGNLCNKLFLYQRFFFCFSWGDCWLCLWLQCSVARPPALRRAAAQRSLALPETASEMQLRIFLLTPTHDFGQSKWVGSPPNGRGYPFLHC